MSRYNTGNPVGSADPRDRDDNSKNLDVAVNTTEDRWTDRFGNERVTLAGGVDPSGFARSALSDANRAEAARDAAFVNADAYDSITDGLDSGDKQFQVVEGDEVVRYRRIDAASADEVARYPSADLARRGADALNAIENRLGLTDLARLLGSEATLVAPVQIGWLWQDLDKNNPATNEGDPVRVIGDQSGRGNDIKITGDNPPILGRDGTRVWVEGQVGGSSWMTESDTWSVFRDRYGIQFCVGWDAPLNTSARLLVSKDRVDDLQINYISAGGSFHFYNPVQDDIRDDRARRKAFPEAVTATFDAPGGEFRVYPGGEFYSETFESSGSEVMLRDRPSLLPALLFPSEDDVPEIFNDTAFRFFGISVVAKPLTQKDHRAFRSTVEPTPAQSPETLRVAHRLAILGSQVRAPFDFVQHLYKSRPGFFIRPAMPFCFQDLAMQVPVQFPGDPVRVVLDQSDYNVQIVAVSDDSRATYQTDGRDEWLECAGQSLYQVHGVRAMNRNDCFFAARVHSIDYFGETQDVIKEIGRNRNDSIKLAIWKSSSEGRYVAMSRGVDEAGITGEDDPGDVVLSVNLSGYDEESPVMDTFENGSFTTRAETSLTGTPEASEDNFEMLGGFEGRFYGAMLCQPAVSDGQRRAAYIALTRTLMGAGDAGTQEDVLTVRHYWIGDIS